MWMRWCGTRQALLYVSSGAEVRRRGSLVHIGDYRIRYGYCLYVLAHVKTDVCHDGADSDSVAVCGGNGF